MCSKLEHLLILHNVGDGDLVLLARALIHCRYIQDAVGVDVKRHLNLGHTTGCRWNAGQLKLAQQVVILCRGTLTLIDLLKKRQHGFVRQKNLEVQNWSFYFRHHVEVPRLSVTIFSTFPLNSDRLRHPRKVIGHPQASTAFWWKLRMLWSYIIAISPRGTVVKRQKKSSKPNCNLLFRPVKRMHLSEYFPSRLPELQARFLTWISTLGWLSE